MRPFVLFSLTRLLAFHSIAVPDFVGFLFFARSPTLSPPLGSRSLPIVQPSFSWFLLSFRSATSISRFVHPPTFIDSAMLHHLHTPLSYVSFTLRSLACFRFVSLRAFDASSSFLPLIATLLQPAFRFSFFVLLSFHALNDLLALLLL